MIVKIGHGANIMGALSYNFQKVDAGIGRVLDAQDIMQATTGTFNLALSYRSFEPYLLANRNTEKPSLHISINPDPKDKVDDDRYVRLAADYMREMGYGNQPYIVFKHTDIERSHIHIVSTNVDQDGKKIRDNYEHKRSMAVCRSLEKKYGLTPPAKAEENFNAALFKPVNYKKENIKGQIAAVVRYLPQYYHYQSLGAYNALLSLFNITAQEVTGEINGKAKQGLVYFALDGNGQKAGHPFKASLFGKSAGHAAMLAKFEKSRQDESVHPLRMVMKGIIETAFHTTTNEGEFKKMLLGQGINVVVRRAAEGRIYGITFIDHESRSVRNGSQFGKGLSANAFNDRWNKEKLSPDQGVPAEKEGKIKIQEEMKEPFHFLDNVISDTHTAVTIIDALTNLLPDAQGDDYEERAFENRMKKKKKPRQKPE